MAIDNYRNADYKDTDGRGRVTLGTDYANTKVAIAWTEVDPPDADSLVTPSQQEREKLAELYRWAAENGHKALDFDPYGGRVYTENAEWVDTSVDGLADGDADE